MSSSFTTIPRILYVEGLSHLPQMFNSYVERACALSLVQRVYIDPALAICWICFLLLLVRYRFAVVKYHHIQNIASKESPQVPPRFPSFIPWLGHGLPFILDNQRFLSHVASYKDKFTSVSMQLLGAEIFVLQDWETVKETRSNTAVGPSILMWAYAHRFFFQIPLCGVRALWRDDTGSNRKPRPGSNPSIAPKDRIHHITHTTLNQAIDGPGIISLTRLMMQGLTSRIDMLSVSKDWTDFDDLGTFFQSTVGEAIIEALTGNEFLKLNPTFNSDLWAFDRDIPWLARGLPSLIMPRANQRVYQLKTQIKKWYSFARNVSSHSGSNNRNDLDPAWGTRLMRDRQIGLSGVEGYDLDCRAATDLGLLWGATANTLPTITWSIIHIFEDYQVRDRVRNDVLKLNSPEAALSPEASPLLNSIFAECLRLHGTMYSLITTSNTDAVLGKWILPRGKLALVNSGLRHMDETAWNTCDGQYPVSEFWADRFLVYPNSPSSGPSNPVARVLSREQVASSSDDNKPHFSLEGVEGSWIPFGASRYTCPGRNLAKSFILLTCATLVRQFDIQLIGEEKPIKQESFGFGLSMMKPVGKVPFRIRRRRQ